MLSHTILFRASLYLKVVSRAKYFLIFLLAHVLLIIGLTIFRFLYAFQGNALHLAWDSVGYWFLYFAQQIGNFFFQK